MQNAQPSSWTRRLYPALAAAIAVAGIASGQWLPAALVLGAMGLTELLGHLHESPVPAARDPWAPRRPEIAQEA